MSKFVGNRERRIQKNSKSNEIKCQRTSVRASKHSQVHDTRPATSPEALSQYSRIRLQDAQNAIDDIKYVEKYLASSSGDNDIIDKHLSIMLERKGNNKEKRQKLHFDNIHVNNSNSSPLPQSPNERSSRYLPRRKAPPPPEKTKISKYNTISPRIDSSNRKKVSMFTNSWTDKIEARERLDQARKTYKEIVASLHYYALEDPRWESAAWKKVEDKASIMKEIDSQLEYEMDLHLDNEDSRRRHFFLKHHLEGKFPHLLKSCDISPSISPNCVASPSRQNIFRDNDNVNRKHIITIPSEAVTGPMKTLVIEEIQNLRSKLTMERKNTIALMKKLERLSDEKYRKGERKEALHSRQNIEKGDVQAEVD